MSAMSARLLFVVPPDGAPSIDEELVLLLRQLQREGFQPVVSLLANRPTLQDRLEALRIPRTTHFDWPQVHWPKYRQLRDAIQSWNADLIHIWNGTEHLDLWWSLINCGSPIVVNDPTGGRHQGPVRTTAMRWLAARTAAIVRAFPFDQDADWRGYPDLLRIDTRFDATGTCEVDSSHRDDIRAELELPDDAQLVAVAHPLELHFGLKDAIWTADLLKAIRDDVHLLLLGTGPLRWRLGRYIRQTDTGDRVHFVRNLPLKRLLPDLTCLWQTAHMPTNPFALELALSHGTPVIATDFPLTRDIISDEKSGFLVAAGDRCWLARRTLQLLEDHDLRTRIASAGKNSLQERVRKQGQMYNYPKIYRQCLRQ